MIKSIKKTSTESLRLSIALRVATVSYVYPRTFERDRNWGGVRTRAGKRGTSAAREMARASFYRATVRETIRCRFGF